MIGYYSCTMMYSNLYGHKEVERRHYEAVLSLRVGEFQTYDLHISDDMKGSNGKSCYACTLAAGFNAISYITDLLYQKGDRTPQMWGEGNGRKANIEFV